MLNDDELKALVRSGDWGRLESEARNVVAGRISKAAELYLLRHFSNRANWRNWKRR
jgi:hypothetical protein